MNKIIASLAASAVIASSANASLILTGIVDGPLSNGLPKGIELYVTADIADLSQYGVELVSNAGSTAGALETAFSGSATAGDFLYVASENTLFASTFGLNPTDIIVTGDAGHNGDDDFYIYGPGGLLIDVWGGSDGVDNSGTAYDIEDGWAYRSNTSGPNTTFTVSEWTISGKNALDGLDAAGTNAAVPFGTYSPIPEPSAFAAIFGALALGAAVARRRR